MLLKITQKAVIQAIVQMYCWSEILLIFLHNVRNGLLKSHCNAMLKIPIPMREVGKGVCWDSGMVELGSPTYGGHFVYPPPPIPRVGNGKGK
jgi:hypothetical protein